MRDDLRRRVERFASGDRTEHTPAVRDEAGRLLDHTGRHGGRIDVADLRLTFRRVSLGQLPAGWEREAQTIATAWRPPAARSGTRP
ncbi:hypothetical protein [Streptomyces sp. V1I1]|uniref:hypothetical protein n=1 Tax=Streptomyces sp. V1I1 TaxID=3042272 RepID=UPI0027895AF0|nr:hypothetical protein [Streptomyces sp. V1I1]MDQ0938339.1 hypothetical protein [Streptomyces sp. V1I1]